MKQELGITALHARITQQCRAGRGDDGAFYEAVRRAKAVYDEALEGWRSQGKDPVFNLVLYVELSLASRVEGQESSS